MKTAVSRGFLPRDFRLPTPGHHEIKTLIFFATVKNIQIFHFAFNNAD